MGLCWCYEVTKPHVASVSPVICKNAMTGEAGASSSAEGAIVSVHDPVAMPNAARIRPELRYAESVSDAAEGAELVHLTWDNDDAALADEDTLREQTRSQMRQTRQGYPVRRTWMPPLRNSVPPGTDPGWAYAR